MQKTEISREGVERHEQIVSEKIMRLSEGHIGKFQEIYLKEYGEEISFDVAHASATRLLSLMRLLCKLDIDEGRDDGLPKRQMGDSRNE